MSLPSRAHLLLMFSSPSLPQAAFSVFHEEASKPSAAQPSACTVRATLPSHFSSSAIGAMEESRNSCCAPMKRYVVPSTRSNPSSGFSSFVQWRVVPSVSLSYGDQMEK